VPFLLIRRSLKRALPQGLLGRTLLILVIPLLLVQVVSTYIFYTTHWDTVAKRLASALCGDIAAAIDVLRVVPDPLLRSKLLTIAAERMDLAIRFRPADILPNQPVEPAPGLMEQALYESLTERVQRPFLVDSQSAQREIQISIQLTDGVLEVTVPRKRLFSSTTYIFVLWMVGTSMLLMGIAMVFMRNQVRSVRKLAVAAESFGKGHEVETFKPEGASEVRQAALAFNLMRDRLKRQIQQRTEMLAGVSHDLRTPLTRMKLQLAIMGDVDGRAELDEDVAEMERMVEGYLAFARGEGGEKPQPVDPGQLVEEVAARFRRQGHVLDLHVEGQQTLLLRPHAMSRAVTNLVGNALRYAGHVWVKVGCHGGAVDIIIDDDGPGIAADKREQVFKPFHRLEESRNQETGGVGLGLTIARDIARGHGGDVVLEDSPLGGLRARIHLPL
jgi:two-component system, OmpR family, osmolarity sensor histidine kinase EnvZ